MKKLLLGGMLVASMFAQVADAAKLSAHGPMMISGHGCAFANTAAVRKVVLQGAALHTNHGNLKAGMPLVIKQKFHYNFKDLAECGLSHVKVTLNSIDKHSPGLDFEYAKLETIGGNMFDLSGGVDGYVTMLVKYTVQDPAKVWKLTQRFSYKHVFQMKVHVEW